MKKLFSAFILLVFVSCNTTPDISRIKQKVFGNLILGSKLSEHNQIQSSLLRTREMQLTGFSNYPYFQIEKKHITKETTLILFPSVYYNSDSVITKIAYYVYSFDFLSPDIVRISQPNEQEMNLIVAKEREDEKKFDLLTKGFTIGTGIDAKYGFNLPTLAQEPISSVRTEVDDFLQGKYGVPTQTETKGDQYGKTDYSYFNESVWKTPNMEIKLITRKFPATTGDPLSFYHVLLYQFNDIVMKKYKLDKYKDLTKTF
jgi:hypothetical protein